MNNRIAKRLAKKILPKSILQAYRRWKTKDWNYGIFYQHLRLNDSNYYLASGLSSKEEFEARGLKLFSGLLKNGLKEDSKILDVGCGPGMITSYLYNFLNHEGIYYGVDVAQEPVDFCKAHFRRDNFTFLKNNDTSIPINKNAYFDMIVFFSVFTHTYPKEMIKLLYETDRLLSKNGVVIATFILTNTQLADTRDLKTWHGTRHKIEYNLDYLIKLIKTTPFQRTEIQDWKIDQIVIGLSR